MQSASTCRRDRSSRLPCLLTHSIATSQSCAKQQNIAAMVHYRLLARGRELDPEAGRVASGGQGHLAGAHPRFRPDLFSSKWPPSRLPFCRLPLWISLA